MNDLKFNILAEDISATLKKTLDKRSSLEIKAGKFLLGEELGFTNRVSTPLSEAYYLAEKFGEPCEGLLIGYRYKERDNNSCMVKLGCVIPSKDCILLVPNENDPQAKRFFMSAKVNFKDIFGFDEVSIIGTESINEQGGSLSSNIAVKKGRVEASLGINNTLSDTKQENFMAQLCYNLSKNVATYIFADGSFRTADFRVVGGIKHPAGDVGVGYSQQDSKQQVTAHLALNIDPKLIKHKKGSR